MDAHTWGALLPIWLLVGPLVISFFPFFKNTES
jgi:hypothetical protein